MRLFSERIVADIEQLPGAGHSYLKQLCSSDGSALRAALNLSVHQLGPAFQARAEELLGSLDNRRFFQGFAETAALSVLHAAGWSFRDFVGSAPRLSVSRGTSAPYLLDVLAFLHQTRPGGDASSRQRLVEGLGRVASKQRFVVLIRRWLPHDFDVDPLRRAVELWLGQVQAGTWDGRYAAYEDDHVSLEFGLTGERVVGRRSPVALVLGPFVAHRAMEVVEPRVVRALEQHQRGAQRDSPHVIACVSDQPWGLNEGYLGDFLYGRPSMTCTGEGATTYTFGGASGPCAFRDPLYSRFAALLLIDRRPELPLELRTRAYLNPWATHPLQPNELAVACFARVAEPGAVASVDASPVLRWYAGRNEALPIG